MSLITCPECGKEKVSDSAESCPECGYGIKVHFDRIKAEEQSERINQARMNLIKMPDKPKVSILGIILSLLAIAVIVIQINSQDTDGIILEIFAAIVLVTITILDYTDKRRKYKIAEHDFEQYKRDEINRQNIEIMKEESKIKCPHCGSANTKKITVSSRVVSTAMVGLASSKIGKQYECKSCGYKW